MTATTWFKLAFEANYGRAALIGGLGGAAVGGTLGGTVYGNGTTRNPLIGAGVGALAGAGLGLIAERTRGELAGHGERMNQLMQHPDSPAALDELNYRFATYPADNYMRAFKSVPTADIVNKYPHLAENPDLANTAVTHAMWTSGYVPKAFE